MADSDEYDNDGGLAVTTWDLPDFAWAASIA